MSSILSSSIQLQRNQRGGGWALAFGFLALASLGFSAPAEAPVSFNRDVRPILSDNCFACHGFDSKTRKAGLRLDVPESALQANKDGKTAIKPGQLDTSEVWQRIITQDVDDVMPPPDSHKTLTAEQKDILRRWILQGAPYQKHWAFERPVKAAPPVVKNQRMVRNPIDQFLLQKLEKEGFGYSPEADRVTLLRRISFALRGLPPTPAEVDEFLADRSPDSYARWVDRFMGSIHFGEEMAKHWLDVARYADTHGMHLDNERSMWPYRDWIVQAFARNLPFDQFTVDQIAGDLLPSPTSEQLVATGFNRCNVTTGEGGSIEPEWLFRYAVDRTSTTVQAWMGLTAGCAVCHDHKYDPLSAREFYSLYAFFNNAADPALDGNILLTAPVVKLPTPEMDQRLAALTSELTQAQLAVTQALTQVAYVDPALQQPPPASRPFENVWLDDEFPSGGKLTAAGAALKWVKAEEGRVHSGKRAIRREEKGLGQDVWETTSASLEVPLEARLFASVYLDPTNQPKSIMLQYHSGGWDHRMVWGDADAIEWGAKGTVGRVHAGPLPKVGEWVQLEFDAAQVGLKSGDRVTGFAVTQFGGLIYWDKVGVRGRIDPANDPASSLLVWQRQNEGKEPGGVPEEVKKIFKTTSLTNRAPAQAKVLSDYYLSRVCVDLKPTFQPLHTRVDDLRKKRSDAEGAIPGSLIYRDRDKPRESFVMLRGQYDRPGEKVTPNVPAIFPPLKNTNNATRLDLARWLVSPDHPMVARVAANRFWQQFFGTGLVKTSDDFGTQGAVPSHPELLDWLAVTFQGSGWDVKALVRLYLTSAAYRQSGRVTPALLEKDPENRWLGRGPRFRLDAEQIRDNALFVSGLIDLTPGGRGVRTYQPPNIWEPVAYVGSNTRDYKADTGPALYRRSLYSFFKRTAPPPFMSSFDAPNREQFCSRRERSNTPLQALQLQNDVQHFEAARALAQRLMLEGGTTVRDRIRFGYRVVLARKPLRDELSVVEEAFQTHLARYRADPKAAEASIHFGESKPKAGLDPAELAAYTLTANLLLNLDETVTQN
jgi:hypothetical protein